MTDRPIPTSEEPVVDAPAVSVPVEVGRDLAHLGRHALRTPDPDATLRYFVDLLGMEVVDHGERTWYLHAYGDYESWSVKVVAAEDAGSDWVSWRTVSEQALSRRIDRLQAQGYQGRWCEPERGMGRSYEFSDPDGHRFRLYFDSDRYVSSPERRPALPTNVSSYLGHGANVRRLDHVNLLARDVRSCREFWQEMFGLRVFEIVRHEDGHGEAAAWMSATIQGHELIYTQERTDASGRLHHLAYLVDNREEVMRAAEIMVDARVTIEAGPSRHTAIQGYYLYTREPGGNRIEIAHGGYLVLEPDSSPHVWDAKTWAAKPSWGAPLPPQFHLYGTPDHQGKSPRAQHRDEHGDQHESTRGADL